MDRAAKIEKARELRAAGETYAAIARSVGVHVTTLRRWIVPGEAERSRAISRAYKDRHRAAMRAYGRRYVATHKAECPQCGGEMNRETARREGKCEQCHADDVHRRAVQIKGWWAAGLLRKEIAANLGWSLGRISVEMHRLRERGYRLPYRRAVHTTPDRKPRFPEQVAA